MRELILHICIWVGSMACILLSEDTSIILMLQFIAHLMNYYGARILVASNGIKTED